MAKTVKEIIISITDKGSLKIATKEVDKLNESINRTNTASKKAGKGASEFDRNMKGASQQSANSTKNFSKMAQGMQSVLVPAYAEVAARVFAVTAAYNALKRAADFSILMKGQSAYAKLTGKNMGNIAKKIQAASGHMIDFADASKSAALASTAGLATDQIVRMTEAARAASVALGRDMNDSMDRLTRGIVKAEPEILDELGIIIRLDRVYKDWAKSLNKTSAELTEYEKLQARTNTILDQANSKFGDIAKTVPANEFARLGAAILDMTHRGAALISEVLGPLAAALSESKILLSLIMTLILKSVIGKALPALKGLGKAFKDLPKTMASGIGGIESKISSLQKKSQVFKEMLGTPKSTEKALRETLDKLKIKKTSKLSEALGKNISGKAFRDEIEKSIIAAVGSANAKISRGVGAGGMFAGQPELVEILARQFKDFNKSLKDSSRSMRSLVGIEFLSWITESTLRVGELGSKILSATHDLVDFNIKLFEITKRKGIISGLAVGFKDFLATVGEIRGEFSNLTSGLNKEGKEIQSTFKKVTNSIVTMTRIGRKSFTLLNRAVTGFVTVTLTKVITALNMITFIMGALSALNWVAGMILDIGNSMGKARDAADSLSDSMESLLDRVKGNTKVFSNFSSNMAEALKTSEFRTNVAEEYANAVEEALRSIDLKDISDDFWGRLIDSIYDAFGAGLDDKLANSITSSIQIGLLKGSKVTPGVAKDLLNIIGNTLEGGKLINRGVLEGPLGIVNEEIESIFSKMRKGAALTNKEIDDLANVLETTGKTQDLFNLLKALGDRSKILAEESKKASTALKELIDTASGFETKRKEFVKALVKGSDFKDLAESFRGLVNIFNSNDIENSLKTLQLFEAGVLTKDTIPQAQDYKKALDYLKEQELILQAHKKSGKSSNTQLKQLEKNVTNASDKVNELGNNLFILLNQKYEGIRGLLVHLFGGDPEKANEDAITLASTIAELKREQKSYATFGIVALEKQNKLERGILEKQRKQLKNKLALTKEGELSVAEKESIDSQIQDYNLRILDTYKNNVQLSESFHEVDGTVYLLSERLKDMEEDLPDDLWQDMVPTLEEWGLREVTKELNTLKNSFDPLFKETQEFNRVSDIATLALEQGLIKDKAALNDILATWKKLNTSLGKFKLGLGISELKSSYNLKEAESKFSVAQQGIDPDSVEAKMVDLREKQIRDLAIMVQQKRDASIEDAVILKYILAQLHTNEQIRKDAEAKYILERKTAKITNTKDRLKAIKGERENLQLERKYHNETTTLLEFKQKMIEIEREYGQEGVENERRKLEMKEIALSYEQLMNNLAEARREERKKELEDIAQAYNNIANAFGNTISSAVSDFAMGKETDWRTSLAQTFADASGNIIGGMVQNNVFGREGIIGKLIPEGSLKDAIFGPEKDSVKISRDMQSLREMAESRGLAVRVINSDDEVLDFWKKHESPNSIATYDEKSIIQLNEIASLLSTNLQALAADSRYEVSSATGWSAEGPADALRHTTAAAFATNKIGPAPTRYLGKLQELSPIGLMSPAGSRSQDLWNNEAGILIGSKIESMAGILNAILLIMQANATQSGDNLIKWDRSGYKSTPSQVTEILEQFRNIWVPQLQKLEQGIIYELPNRAIAEDAYKAMLKGATPGSFYVHDIKTEQAVKNSDGTNVNIIKDGIATDLNIKDEMKSTLKSGFSDVVRNGHLDAQSLAASFAGNMASKAADKATDFIFDSIDFGSLFGFEKGGIAKGGFRAFASGGVVNRPTLGLMGEGNYNEAIVPLPDGKSIPVIGNTGGDSTNNITINVNVDQDGNARTETEQSGGMDEGAAQQLGYMVSQAVQAELVEQQRPGGLLSRYQ